MGATEKVTMVNYLNSGVRFSGSLHLTWVVSPSVKSNCRYKIIHFLIVALAPITSTRTILYQHSTFCPGELESSRRDEWERDRWCIPECTWDAVWTIPRNVRENNSINATLLHLERQKTILRNSQIDYPEKHPTKLVLSAAFSLTIAHFPFGGQETMNTLLLTHKAS